MNIEEMLVKEKITATLRTLGAHVDDNKRLNKLIKENDRRIKEFKQALEDLYAAQVRIEVGGSNEKNKVL